MFRYSLFSLLLFPIIVSANTMSQSFNEGRDIGRSNNSGAQNAVKQISPNEFQGYQAPEQSKHYTGITGSEPNLNALGMQEMTKSEIGQTIRSSTINNPKDKISMDSDMIQRSFEINKNAKAISGINGKQCVKQVMSKTNFSYHYCEKEQEIIKTCKMRDVVEWSGNKSTVKRNISFKENDMSFERIDRNGRNFTFRVKFNLLENVNLTGIDFKVTGNSRFQLNNIVLNSGGTGNANNGLISIRNIFIPLRKGENSFSINVYIGSDGFMLAGAPASRYLRETDNNLTIYYDYEEDSLKATLKKVSDCDIKSDDSVQLSMQCTQKGETRNFFKDGKNISLYSGCWEETYTYLVNESSDNECKRYDENPNCTVGERECIAKIGDDCVRHKIKYQCANTTKIDGYVCGDQFFCSDGSCSDLDGSINTDFGHAVSQLATLAQAGKDVGLDEQNIKAFSGKAMFCRKSGFGFSDCCKDSGWGHKVGLAKCNTEENALGRAKEKNLVIYTGTYCDKKVLGKCVRRKSSYCVFDNKLARIIQYQGRSGQLGIGFGDAKNPNCRGLNVEELQSIDFNAMDYSDFYHELNERQAIPDKNQLIDYMKNTITEQLQQE